jgi:formate dehydrogenase iron-sulfur subunit
MVALLVDITKCTGCEKCVLACIEKNKLNLEKSYFDRVTARDGLSADRFLSINKINQDHFTRLSCMHCLEPACVSACLVSGITKSKEGAVIYDPDKCIGCRYCMLACQFHIPRYEWNVTKPFMKKCNLCYDRIKENELPACVEACPNDAIIFGDRKKLLKQAHRIINSKSEKYLKHVWGEKEYGGTSVLYISDIDLAKIGWSDKPVTPIPHLTEPLIEKTPVIGLTVGGFLVGLNWIIKRRMEFAGQNDKIRNKIKKENRQGND